MSEKKEMRSIWYFVGLMLLVVGVIIFITGLYYMISPAKSQTVLYELHPDVWWGFIMAVVGVVFLLTSGRRKAETKEG